MSYQVRGNNAADEEAKRVAGNYSILLTVCEIHKNEGLSFDQKEKEKLHQMGVKEQDGKYILPDGREMLPKGVALDIISRIHEKTHWGTQALVDHFER